MFALTRKIGERLYIGDNVILAILDTDGQCARIGIDAPREILVLREELISLPIHQQRPTRTSRLPRQKARPDADHSPAKLYVVREQKTDKRQPRAV